jgi:restriction system protein
MGVRVGWGMKRNKMQWRDGLAQASWQDFERMLARHYREEGYEVEHSGTAESHGRFDGGVDLVLKRDGETTLVQCKRWNAMQVPHNDVHQLLGLLETRQAQRAVLITSGEFTKAARDAASRTPRIQLIDGMALRLMVDPRLIPAPQANAPSSAGARLESWAPVAEKAIDAFMDVKTGGRWRKARRQTPEEVLKELGLRLLLLAAALILIVMVFRNLSQNIQTTLASPKPRPAAATPSSPNPSPSARVPRSVQTPLPDESVPMTPEQLKEWERKNAEAMEVLEKTTPSVND